MKKLLFALMLAIVGHASAFDVYNGTNAAGKPQTSISTVSVNPTDGTPMLQQDMINMIISGQPRRSFGYVFGRNSLVQNVLCDLWDGPTCTYVFPVTAQQMTLSSTSAADTLAGTGIQKIIIHYLDDTYHIQSETVSMNGVTPVNTVATNILRINSMHAAQEGTGASAAGNISLKNIAGTVTYAFLSAGVSTARQAIYTVPAAKYGFISHWHASSGTVTGTHFTPVRLRATSHDGILLPGIFLVVDEIGTPNNGNSITLPTPIRVPPTTDVKLSAISDAANANAQVMGTIMGWFEDQ